MSERIRSRWARVFLAWVLVFSLSAQVPVRAQKPEPTADGMRWPMKYEEGTEPIEHDTKLQVTVGENAITCARDNGAVLFTVPVKAVQEISYDNKVRRRLAEAAGVAVLSLGAALVFTALTTKKHFVNVVWEESGQAKEVIFKVGKGEYAAFLADLQRVTGMEWKDLAMERERTRQEIKTNKNRKVAVQLDKAVRVGESELKSGTYQIVLLERAENQGELYFFRGNDVNPKKIDAAALVDIVPEGTGGAPQVSYQENGGVAAIAEIRLAAKTLRLRQPSEKKPS